MRTGLALLVIVLAAGCGVTSPAPPRVTAGQGPTRHVLPNGIPVIVQEHRASDVVAIQLWVLRAGGRDETATELGLAQAVEAVTADDVTAAARRYLTRPTVVVLQPPPAESR